MQEKEENVETTETGLETRRDMLRRIGTSLAAISVAAIVGNNSEVAAQRLDKNIIRIPTDVKTVLPDETKELNVFVSIAKKRGGSVVVVDSTDREAIAKLKKQLGVNPARATVSGGIVQIDLGVAAEGRCTLSKSAAIGFNPGDPIDMKLRTIQRMQ